MKEDNFLIMEQDNEKENSEKQPFKKASWSVTDYYIKTEFTAGGYPHVHCILWINNTEDPKTCEIMIDGELNGKYTKFPSAPTFDNTVAGKTGKEREDAAQIVCDFADMVMRGKKVDEGAPLSKEIGSFQQHNHTFTCHKKRKKCVIYPNEGHSKTKKMTKKPRLKK